MHLILESSVEIKGKTKINSMTKIIFQFTAIGQNGVTGLVHSPGFASLVG